MNTKRTMLTALGALIVMSTTLAQADPTATKGLLDGKNFQAQMGEEGKKDMDKDELLFSAGTFRSTGCDAYGFKATQYSAKADKHAVTFMATSKSEKEGEMKWQGEVHGKEISGTAVWTKPGQKPIRYTFKGTQR